MTLPGKYVNSYRFCVSELCVLSCNFVLLFVCCFCVSFILLTSIRSLFFFLYS